MEDGKKDLVEHGSGALVATAVGGAAAGALAAVPGALLGIVAIVDHMRGKRVREWWDAFVELDGDPAFVDAALAGRLEAEPQKAAAIVSGARAAAEVVAGEAIRPIALLTRAYARQSPPVPSTTFRGLLRLLTDLDVAALDQLARFAHLVDAFLRTSPRMSRVAVYVEKNTLWEVRRDGGDVELGELLAGHIGDRGAPHTRRMLRSLKAEGLADDATNIKSNIPQVDAVAVERTVVELLVGVLPTMPPPPTPT